MTLPVTLNYDRGFTLLVVAAIAGTAVNLAYGIFPLEKAVALVAAVVVLFFIGTIEVNES